MSTLSEYIAAHAEQCVPNEAGAVDVIFFGVKAKPTADAAALRSLVDKHEGEFHEILDVFCGLELTYIELGAWLGDQGAALTLIGLGGALGMWEVLTPRTAFGEALDRQTARSLAGHGMVALKAPPPATQSQAVPPATQSATQEADMQLPQPIQPLVDVDGKTRFQGNAIVRMLLDWAKPRGMDLNAIACLEFSNADRQQFAQLIGYSLSGYGELPYVDDEAYEAAAEMEGRAISADAARVKVLQRLVDELRRDLREPIARLYGKHPDDLMERPAPPDPHP